MKIHHQLYQDIRLYDFYFQNYNVNFPYAHAYGGKCSDWWVMQYSSFLEYFHVGDEVTDVILNKMQKERLLKGRLNCHLQYYFIYFKIIFTPSYIFDVLIIYLFFNCPEILSNPEVEAPLTTSSFRT